MDSLSSELRVQRLGLVGYLPTLRAMREFTARRDSDTPNEIWLLEHTPVYTTGLNGKNEHFPKHDSGIPVITTDRGGQITYHGPGQAIVYLLLDLKRKKLGIRAVVRMMEQAVIEVLRTHSVIGDVRAGMPGVYVDNAKIAALGLRVTRGCCYHGLALNVDMDLTPFRFINPCGYPALPITQTKDLGITASVDELANEISDSLIAMLDKS
ncbi:MAG: lipoyl(octanoyl) transferase LipB [Burkholderiales bacterium]